MTELPAAPPVTEVPERSGGFSWAAGTSPARPRRGNRRLALIIATVAALAVVAGLLVWSSGDVPSSWLARPDDGAIYLEWTERDGELTGSMSLAYVDDADPFVVQADTLVFSGILDDPSVTLTVDQGLGLAMNWNGRLNGPVLTLTYAAEDGTLTSLDFTPADAPAYNEAVRALRRSVAQELKLELQRVTIDESAAAVSADLEALAEDLEFAQSDLQAVSDDLGWMRDDVTFTQQDLQAVVAPAERYPGGNFGQVCYDAEGVSYDAETVSYDAETVSYDADYVRDDLDAISAHVSQLEGDFAALQAGMEALPSYRPSPMPTEQEVADALRTANQGAQDVGSSLDALLAEADQLVLEAQGYAADAQGVCAETGG